MADQAGGRMLTIGIDEAGRGPILGPMVLAAVALAPRKAAGLTRIGVCDSKAFGAGEEAHAVRSTLVPRILAAAGEGGWSLSIADVAEIDAHVVCGALNQLERRHADRLLRRLPPANRIVADGERLFLPLRSAWPELHAIDRGEEAHVAVAAASILAKVRRDELWLRIAGRYRPNFGQVGGMGYVNVATKLFLRRYIEQHRHLPPEARRTWPWHFAADLLPQVDVRADVPQAQLGFQL